MSLKDRPIILLGDGEAADAKARLLHRAGAHIMRDRDAPAALAIVALEDEGEAQAAAAHLRARGVLLNVVDRPQLCDFTLPAIVDRSPVIIAIGTGGASASLAKALRQWLEAVLPQGLGALALALRQARGRIAAQLVTPAVRRRFLDDLLAIGVGPLDPLQPHDAPSVAIERALQSAIVAADTGRLDHIALTSADPDDLTLRAARLLAQADRIYHAADVPPAILDRARADAARIAAPPPDSIEAGRSVLITMEHQ